MNLSNTKTVGEIATENPISIRAFEKFGIDYCCGGKKTLADACSVAGVNVDEFENYLKTIERFQQSDEMPNLSESKLSEVVNYILDKHHVFTKNEIQRLDSLITKVCKTHGENHPEVLSLNVLFQHLCEDLIPHIMKEEQILFPYIFQLEEAAEKAHRLMMPPFMTVNNPVRMMMVEHDRAGEILRKMRKVTHNYTLPDDACNSFRALYYGLEEFEGDLHQHIHLENNILFPRAIDLERKVQAEAV
jgi:regulator of cell morphogenesis and NO signaling